MLGPAPVGERHRPQGAPRNNHLEERRSLMPKDRDNSSGHAQDGESSMLKNFILLALPLLSLQRDMLAIVKKGIQDTSHVKPVQNLTLRELQALMMILDPKRKLRDRFGADFEKKLEDLYKET